MIEIRQKDGVKLNISPGSEHLLKFLEDNKNNDNKFLISTKSELAKQYGLSLSTVSKRLTELINNRVIDMISKRGKNGGIIITFLVKPTEDFKTWERKNENIIQSESEYAVNLREQVFPKYIRPLGNGRPRRTKKEMIAYRLAKDEKERTILNMNLECEVTYPSKRIFEMSPDPEGYFRAYILAKLYDILCYHYMQHAYEYFSEHPEQTQENIEGAKHYDKKRNNFLYSDILGKDFFGERRFNTFYNLQAKLQEWDLTIHDFKYIHSVFGNYLYFYEQRRGTSKALGSPVPYINYFHSESTLQQFIKHTSALKRNRSRFGDVKPIEQRIASTGAKTLTYQSLKRLYDMGLGAIDYDFDTKFENSLTLDHILDIESANVSYDNGNDQLDRNSIAYTSYNSMVKSLPNNMENNEKELMIKFLKQSHILMANNRAFDMLEKAAIFPLQQRAMLEKVKSQEMFEEYKDVAYSKVSTIDGTLYDSELEGAYKTGEEIDIMCSQQNWWNILMMYGHYRNMTVNGNEVKRIIDKYELDDDILLDLYGLLDYNKIINNMLKEEKFTCLEE